MIYAVYEKKISSEKYSDFDIILAFSVKDYAFSTALDKGDKRVKELINNEAKFKEFKEVSFFKNDRYEIKQNVDEGKTTISFIGTKTDYVEEIGIMSVVDYDTMGFFIVACGNVFDTRDFRVVQSANSLKDAKMLLNLTISDFYRQMTGRFRESDTEGIGSVEEIRRNTFLIKSGKSWVLVKLCYYT